MFIMTLVNAHFFFIEKAFILLEEKKYFLLVLNRDTFFKKECKSLKGAKIAFVKNFGSLNPYAPKMIWTSFYSPSEKIDLPSEKSEKFDSKSSTQSGLRTVKKSIELIGKSSDFEMSFMSVKYVAEMIKVVDSYLSRKFKEDTGMPLNKFINAEKMLRAIEFAKKGTNSDKARIILGFGRNDYFHYLFKKRFYINYQDFKSSIMSVSKKNENT